MTYPEFRSQFSDNDCKWYGGHLVKKGDLYYKLVKIYSEDNPKSYTKELKSYTYNELTEWELNKIADQERKDQEDAKNIDLVFGQLIPAREKVIDYVMTNGRLADRSNQSESEYWYVKSRKDNLTYKVRISGHVYPTGSMTNVLMQVLDTTDYDCRRFIEILGI